MPPFAPDPRITKDAKVTQLSYDLPHRIHTIKSYPTTSNNGSTIILYGHEKGLRVVWRGGRPFKATAAAPAPTKPAASKSNGNVAIDLSSDSDEEVIVKFTYEPVDYPKFEDADEPLDAEAPFPPVRQFIDLDLGVGVTDLAIPTNITPDSVDSSHSLISIVKQRMLFVMVCSDHKVRAMTLPLQPPSPGFKAGDDSWVGTKYNSAGIGYYGEQILKLDVTYQDMPNSIACTLSPSDDQSEDFGHNEGEEGGDHPVWYDFRDGKSDEPMPNHNLLWDFVIAVHSPERSGLIDVYRWPISIPPAKTASQMRVKYKWWGLDHNLQEFSPGDPCQETQYLTSPASQISFNPCTYPNPRHSHLLITQPNGQVKIWDAFPNRHRHERKRRAYEPAEAEPGIWLITLNAPFATGPTTATASSSLRRKGVLSAQWVLGGRAVLALLSDGEWGVWDVEGTGPTPAGSALSYNITNSLLKRGLQGSAVTAFNLSGWINSDRPAIQKSRRESNSRSSSSSFAIRTPHTRLRDEQKLFATSPSSSGPSSTSKRPRGGVAVRNILPAKASGGEADEAVVFWYGTSFAAIPSLRTFWETQLVRSKNGGSLFLADGKDRLLRLGEARLDGETLGGGCEIEHVPPKKPGSIRGGEPQPMPDVLVGGEYKLVVFSVDKDEKPRPGFSFGRSQAQDEQEDDSGLFGELELGGIERALSKMDKGGPGGRKRGRGGSLGRTAAGRRRVGFR